MNQSDLASMCQIWILNWYIDNYSSIDQKKYLKWYVFEENVEFGFC